MEPDAETKKQIRLEAIQEWKQAKTRVALKAGAAGKDLAEIYDAMHDHVREYMPQFVDGVMTPEERTVFVQASDLLFRMGVWARETHGNK